jgi:hypothetical protein
MLISSLIGEVFETVVSSISYRIIPINTQTHESKKARY